MQPGGKAARGSIPTTSTSTITDDNKNLIIIMDENKRLKTDKILGGAFQKKRMF